MAASALTVSGAKPLDPLRQSKFTLHVSDGLLSQPRNTTAFSSVRYNFKPRLQAKTSRTSTISHAEDERARLTLADQSGDGAAKFTYVGRRKDLKRSFALVFDQDHQRCTLEPLASTYAFNIQSTPTESSAAKLADRYPRIRPKSDVDAISRAATDGNEADPHAPADDDNPYDFRHFMKQARATSRSVSPDAPRSRAATPLNGTRTPLSRPNVSTASPTVNGKRPTAPTKSSPPAGTTLRKPKSSNAPEVRLERKATARAAPPAKKSKSLKSITRPKKNPTIKSNEFVGSSDDDDMDISAAHPPRKSAKETSDGGLEIDFGDSTPLKPQSQVSKAPKRNAALLDTPNNGPISLRSAANSAAASPAHGFAGRPFQRHKSYGDGQVIDFGESAPTAEEASDEESDADAGGEYDRDIEPMTLGSPAHEPRSASAGRPSEDIRMEDEADAEGDDHDFDNAFEEAYLQLSEADNDMDAAAAAAPAGNESEESEEE